METKKLNWKFMVPWVLLIVFVVTRLTGLWGTYIVSGQSMMPNYKDGQFLLGSNIGLKNGVERHDVVFVTAPDGEKVIKRIIGLPGETVRIEQGKVYINNQLLPEDYLDNAHTTLTYDYHEIQLGDNEIFIMGDNRDNSLDSRYYGPVTLDKLISQPLW